MLDFRCFVVGVGRLGSAGGVRHGRAAVLQVPAVSCRLSATCVAAPAGCRRHHAPVNRHDPGEDWPVGNFGVFEHPELISSKLAPDKVKHVPSPRRDGLSEVTGLL